jgi:hypothetical protein
MRGSEQFGPKRAFSFVALVAAAFALCILPSASAQINGTPPSVMSIPLSHFLPNPRPSVTSLGPFGYGPGMPSNLGTAPNIRQYPFRQFPYTRPRGRGFGGGYGYSYAIPYYVPYDASGYGYDYVGGPDMYSGPPIGPSEPTLHIIVEQPPAPPQAYQGAKASEMSSDRRARPEAQEPPPPQREEHPVNPTILVFRDGHKQEVSNYAIMGQVVYVFDDHTKKIALAELDVPATVKANDDRGLEFKLPPQVPAKQKDTVLPKQSAPVTSAQKPSSIATLILP